MSNTPYEPADAGDDHEDLRERARERIENLPSETALGNADPAAGVDRDPRTYEGENNA